MILACDFDDTVTEKRQLPAKTLSAFELLISKGFRVVIVTGRPAGWCDLMARFFPVHAVVGENGAFIFEAPRSTGAGVVQHTLLTAHDLDQAKKKFPLIQREIFQQFPNLRISLDQAYRKSDLAIDFAEEVTGSEPETPDEVKKIFEKHGACAKVSSIHVNGWFGNFDKLTALKKLGEIWNIPRILEHTVYVGDSPNDQPMFEAIKRSVGVANINNYPGLTPAYVTEAEEALGFLEVIDVLCGH